MSRETNMMKLVEMFRTSVKGKKAPAFGSKAHDGATGHWLERQFGIAANATNEADIFGFELKSDTSSKTTFGDWSADRYIFDKEYGDCSRQEFFRIFGAPNKDGRYSWSGKPVPKVDEWNSFGQRLILDEQGSIYAVYDFDRDQRAEKVSIVPSKFQNGIQPLAIWLDGSLRKRVENKFGKHGWFKCLADDSGTLVEIGFGEPISFDSWIKDVANGVIFLDSGMKEDNLRPYSSWRADNAYWDKRIVSRFR